MLDGFLPRSCLGRKSFSRQAIGCRGKETVEKRDGDHIFAGICRCVAKIVILPPRKSIALVVQWIERKFPKL